MPDLGALAGRVFMTSSGRIYVPVAADRQAILALKHTPDAVASLVTAATRLRAARLQVLLARPPRLTEIYMAHLLGTDSAHRLIMLAAREPRRSAAEEMPEAALANPAAFFTGTRPATAEQVVRKLSTAFDTSLQQAVRPSPRVTDARLKAVRPDARESRGWRTSIAAAK